MIHLDTCFIVDLLREKRRNEIGPASRLLDDLVDEELAISAYVLCELRAGAEMARSSRTEHEAVTLIENSIAIAPIDASTANYYGRLLAHLKHRGIPVAAVDLLIASVCLASGASLVTRNLKHFKRVPELEVLGY